MMTKIAMMTNRRLLKILLLGLIPLFISSCEKDLPIYNVEKGRINFSPKDAVQKLHSFVYSKEEVVQDTVWFSVVAVGGPEDRDRFFEIEQVIPEKKEKKKKCSKKKEKEESEEEEEEEKNTVAVAGVHYVPFNDSEYRTRLYIPANKIETRIPIIVKRAPDLKRDRVSLIFRLKETSDFDYGFPKLLSRSVMISDRLERPQTWGFAMNYYFGKYSRHKHKFMIDTVNQNWDDAYIKSLYLDGAGDSSKRDENYVNLLVDLLKGALKEYAIENDGPLLDEDGQEITFERFKE